MRLFPKFVRDLERIDFPVLPPRSFVARLVQFPVMTTTQRHREFVAHFQADRSGLGKPNVMWIAWLTLADHARLRCHEFQMRLVTQTLWFGQDELAFIDASGSFFGTIGGAKGALC